MTDSLLNSDADTTIEEASRWVLDFSKERDWEKFHNPKDLTLALVCEVAEILEHFRYKTQAEIAEAFDNPKSKTEIAHELADCFWLVLRLGEICKIDLAQSLRDKLRLAALKYPVDQSYGRSDKYTHYQAGDPSEPT